MKRLAEKEDWVVDNEGITSLVRGHRLNNNCNFYKTDFFREKKIMKYKNVISLERSSSTVCILHVLRFRVNVYFQDPLIFPFLCVFGSLRSLNNAWSKCCSRSKNHLRSNQEKSM